MGKGTATHLRARALYDNGRYELARDAARQAIAEDPQAFYPHSLLALCLSQLDEDKAAIAEAKKGISLLPDDSYPHYVLGTVALSAGKIDEARSAATVALSMDPTQERYCALMGGIRFAMREWKECLEFCEMGLDLNPNDQSCLTLRGRALTKLGLVKDAVETLKQNLALHPEEYRVHVAQGWALLHARNYDEALNHFREALRLQPDSKWARDGLLEALRARYPVYRVILRYLCWVRTLKKEERVLVPFLLSFFISTFGSLIHGSLVVTIIFVVAVAALMGFMLLNWTAPPLFNLLLRLHPLGKYALSKSDRLETVIYGVGISVAATMLAFGAALHREALWGGSIVVFLLSFSLGTTCKVVPDKHRRFMAWLVASAGAAASLYFIVDGLRTEPKAVASYTMHLSRALASQRQSGTPTGSAHPYRVETR